VVALALTETSALARLPGERYLKNPVNEKPSFLGWRA
jgi:hypothetical protein